MKRKSNHKEPIPRTPSDEASTGFVAGGFDRFVSGVESETRRIVEEKYADEWNTSGLIRRWQLQRRIDAEVAARVPELMPDVSPEAVF